MVLGGKVKNGAIVLDVPQSLPEGSRLRVEVLEPEVADPIVSVRALFGSVSVGPGNSADNELIDADLARAYANEV